MGFSALKAFSLRHSVGACVVLALAAYFMCTSLWYGLHAAWSDASTLASRWLVVEWREGRGPVFDPQTWKQTVQSLQEGIQITPDHPQLYDDIAYLHASRALSLGNPVSGNRVHQYQLALIDEAIANYRTASSLRPTFPYSWAYLALAKQVRGQYDPEFWLAFDKAMQFGSTESGVRGVLVEIACARWPDLTPGRSNAVRSMVDVAPPPARDALRAIALRCGIPLSQYEPAVAP